jgi:hypothetical protein
MNIFSVNGCVSGCRICLALAEQERCGGVSPHVSPATKISDVGNLLQHAGFALPTGTLPQNGKIGCGFFQWIVLFYGFWL